MRKITYLTLLIALTVASSVPAEVKSAPKIRWKTYASPALSVRMTVPASWVLEKTTEALAFHSPGSLDTRAGIGLMRSANRGSIKKAADARMATKGLEGWSRSYMRVGGMRAMEVVGHPEGNPKLKIVRYFITTPSGPYLLQCVAPSETWFLYRQLFATIIKSIRFS
jgi:hypothetical protein